MCKYCSNVFYFFLKTFCRCKIMFIFASDLGEKSRVADALAITINNLRKLYEKELSFFQNKKKTQILEKTRLFFTFIYYLCSTYLNHSL